MIFKEPIKNTDKTGLILVLISSVLMGIWATMETIALRNILLAVGSLFSILYLLGLYRSPEKELLKKGISLFTTAPLALIFFMLVWVVAHYLFFSADQSRQWYELTSTWLRAFLAVLVGLSTGIALTQNNGRLPLLWLGLLISFVVLMGQYIPKAIQRESYFAIDHFGSYIYWAKFNGVLAGTVLIAGLLGMSIDFLSASGRNKNTVWENRPDRKSIVMLWLYAILGIFLAAYSFVFIFDAKAGVGLAVILIGFWALSGLIVLGVRILRHRCQKEHISSSLKLISLLLLSMIVITFLAWKHVKNNPGWESLLEDIAISAQIEKYPNWQNPSKLGFPKRDDGSSVAGNTYERVSWGVVGYKLILMEPLGSGVLRSFPDQVKKLVPEFSGGSYTHSGWIDLGLSFGILGLVLIPIALSISLIRSLFFHSYDHRATVISLSLAILVLYGVGEYAFQHGIEILFYLSGLISGLTLIPSVKKQNTSH
jgi:hypothetical protein